MNIKITKKQRDELAERRTENIQHYFGSQLYGTATENSDFDVIIFYKDFLPVKGIPQNHLFQYDDVDNNRQEIWCGKEQFWHILNRGDSNIFAEHILFNSDYSDIEKINICKTYNILKCFLGYIKRDLKKNTEKRINHAIRGIYIVRILLNSELPTVEGLHKELKALKTTDISILRNICDKLREILVSKFQVDEIPLYYIPKVENELHQLLIDSINIREFIYN
jgi:hypothetical protein